MPPQQGHGVGERRVIDPLRIGLVDDEEGVRRDAFRQGLQLVVTEDRARGIVRIADDHGLGARGRLGQRPHVELPLPQRDLDELALEEPDQAGVRRIGGQAGHAAVSPFNERQAQAGQDVVRAVGDAEVLRGQPEPLGEPRAQPGAFSVRIVVGAVQGPDHGFTHAGGDAERIFVAPELDHLGQPEARHHLFGRPAGDVRLQCRERSTGTRTGLGHRSLLT